MTNGTNYQLFQWRQTSIICHSTGVDPEVMLENDHVYNDFVEYLNNHEPLDKQQSQRQWVYFANTITKVCEIFGVNKENYEDKYNLFNKYSALGYLSEICDINNP